MTIVSENADDLKEPFEPQFVHWRVQSNFVNKGQKAAFVVPYLDARRVEERLDDVLGPEQWQATYEEMEIGGAVIVKCSLKMFDSEKQNIVLRQDYGEEEIVDYNNNALLTAKAQAFKRACSAFGLGRYLYLDAEEEYVELKESHKGLENAVDARLEFDDDDWTTTYYFERPTLPDRALPQGYGSGQSKQTSSSSNQGSGEGTIVPDEEPSAPDNGSGEQVVDADAPDVPESADPPESDQDLDFDREENLGFGNKFADTAWKDTDFWYIDWMIDEFDDGELKQKAIEEKKARIDEKFQRISELRGSVDISNDDIITTLEEESGFEIANRYQATLESVNNLLNYLEWCEHSGNSVEYKKDNYIDVNSGGS